MKFISFLFFMVACAYVQAQSEVEMADNFRGEGKIYVVIIVILIILVGFLFLLFRLDRRTKSLEEKIDRK